MLESTLSHTHTHMKIHKEQKQSRKMIRQVTLDTNKTVNNDRNGFNVDVLKSVNFGARHRILN